MSSSPFRMNDVTPRSVSTVQMLGVDDGASLPNQCQRQKFVVFRITTSRLNAQLIGLLHVEKVSVLTNQRHKRKPGLRVQIAVKLVALEDLLQRIERPA